MSKTEILSIVGSPDEIDTTEAGLEVLIYRPPRGTFAEWPRCYFNKGDSIMVEFWWEPIHLILQNSKRTVDGEQPINHNQN